MQLEIRDRFKNLLFALAPEERNQLEANILEFGCREPLVIWRGILIDGHNRYDICQKHSLPFATVEVDLPDEEAVDDWIDANQLGRRNLTPDGFKLALGRRYNRTKKKQAGTGANQHTEQSGQIDHSAPTKTAQILAETHGVSEKTVRRAGEFAEEVERNPIVQEAIANRVPVQKVKKEQRSKEIAKQRDEIAQKAKTVAVNNRFLVVQADMSTYHLPEPVDIIITDPPYPREFLPLWNHLAKRANDWLKPNGIIIAMSGQAYLDQVYAMMSEHLDYYWTACYYTPGQPTPLRHVNVNTNWKPLLIYTRKGERYGGKIFGDVATSTHNDKDFHKWGQSVTGMEDIVRRFTIPGQTVFDPFCGAGTTGVAAVKNGCFFHGIDIEKQNVDISLARIAEVAVDAEEV
jgi:16S rRNA G966 N2-methylase RsmD